jgi:Ca2+-binding RTX toxin-like protein
MALIYGEPNKDVIGTNQADEIHLNGKANAYGRGGDDTINGSSSDNKLYGQDGSDVLSAGGGNNLLDGGAGDDYLYSSEGSNKFYGGAGNDSISASGSDSAWGGAGNDTLGAGWEGLNSVKLYGEAGNDWIRGGEATDFLDGGSGNDTLFGSMDDTLRGGAGNDEIWYSSWYKWTDQATQESHGVVSGGAGQDLLRFSVALDDPFTAPRIEVFMTGESRGHVTIDDLPKLTFTGINEIVDYSDGWDTNAKLFYHGENADTDMKVTGGDLGNTFFGGKGNETFVSGAGDDHYIFVFKEGTMGHDKIGNFGQEPGQIGPSGPGFDTIYFAGAEGKLTTIKTEFPDQNGNGGTTRYESYYNNGKLAHVLEVDAIGLPPISTWEDTIG